MRKLVEENFPRWVFNLFRGLWLVQVDHFANSVINFEIIFRNAAPWDSIISTFIIKMLKMSTISSLIFLLLIITKMKMLSALKSTLSKDGHGVTYFDMKKDKHLTVYDCTFSTEIHISKYMGPMFSPHTFFYLILYE